MLLNRRAVLTGPLALIPAAKADDHELLAHGAQLKVLRQRVMAKRRAMTEGAGWAKWNAAMAESVALAERIGRMPAHDVAGFAVKLRALAWAWDDDLDDHQLRRLRALAREMERPG